MEELAGGDGRKGKRRKKVKKKNQLTMEEWGRGERRTVELLLLVFLHGFFFSEGLY